MDATPTGGGDALGETAEGWVRAVCVRMRLCVCAGVCVFVCVCLCVCVRVCV